MPNIDLSPYKINQVVPVTGAFEEWPATWRDPRQAPIVFLVDEEHETQPAINQNAGIVHQIIQAVPSTIVVLEHFLAGQVVTKNTPRTYGGSNFHILLHQLGPATTIGGDDKQALAIVAAIEADYERRRSGIVVDIRNAQSIARGAAEEARLKQEGYQKMHTHPANVIRSQRLIETLLNQMTTAGVRVGAINAGANHNSHIWDNVIHNGQPLSVLRSQVTFIRLRPAAHPMPLVIKQDVPPHGPSASIHERRHISAFFHWIDRGRPYGQEMVDWTWAEQQVTS
jgi:hypothetical protein